MSTKPVHELNTVIDAIRGTGRWGSADPSRSNSSAGNKSVIASRLGVHRSTVKNYAKRWLSVREAIEDEKEALIDLAESKVLSKIQSGDTTMIIFTLKAHPVAKRRGWSEKTEHEHAGPGGGAIIVEWDDPTADH